MRPANERCHNVHKVLSHWLGAYTKWSLQCRSNSQQWQHNWDSFLHETVLWPIQTRLKTNDCPFHKNNSKIEILFFMKHYLRPSFKHLSSWSRSYENTFRSNFAFNFLNRFQFCKSHESWAVIACAKAGNYLSWMGKHVFWQDLDYELIKSEMIPVMQLN